MAQKKESLLKRIENMHPYQTLMYLGMFGSGLIFLFMTVAFLASGTGNMEGTAFRMPKSFMISTLVILLSSFSAFRMNIAFEKEELKNLKNNLLYTFFLGLIFTGLQFFGWRELTRMGVDFRGLPSGSFLYVLSGIHLFHLIGAMVFALIMVMHYQRSEKDSIKHLLLLTNPYEKMKIQLFSRYWHFMDIIWMALFLIFVLTF